MRNTFGNVLASAADLGSMAIFMGSFGIFIAESSQFYLSSIPDGDEYLLSSSSRATARPVSSTERIDPDHRSGSMRARICEPAVKTGCVGGADRQGRSNGEEAMWSRLSAGSALSTVMAGDLSVIAGDSIDGASHEGAVAELFRRARRLGT
ncbi:hypothetical protein [Methylobacterium sp. WL9]|uniref:hypothetical protein n=1 Tax=Methylobacterium sp. WL9 TaxID=2603898 RepID=UPI0011CCD2C1|nr:hypothetical protein [Methylobacterium sp. WL9]TXN22702.1 hypothetical protein FV217_09760 [Methylobacterium sp. WL9]